MTILLVKMTNQNMPLFHCWWNRIGPRREKFLGTSKCIWMIHREMLVEKGSLRIPHTRFYLENSVLPSYIVLYVYTYYVNINF